MEQLAGYDGWPEGESRLLESYRERLRARARNIAWSAACITPWNRWGDSILAVANDCLEVVLFRYVGGCRACETALTLMEVVLLTNPRRPWAICSLLGKMWYMSVSERLPRS